MSKGHTHTTEHDMDLNSLNLAPLAQLAIERKIIMQDWITIDLGEKLTEIESLKLRGFRNQVKAWKLTPNEAALIVLRDLDIQALQSYKESL